VGVLSQGNFEQRLDHRSAFRAHAAKTYEADQLGAAPFAAVIEIALALRHADARETFTLFP
jgi:hypothetical protein